MLKKMMVVLLVLGLGTVALAQDTLTAGFIYVGPVGDYGWTYSHDRARLIAEETFPWLDTMYVESVTEGELETYIEMLIDEGAEVIFTTSFGFMDGTYAVAARNPDIIFAHASGYTRAPNMATYMSDLYQSYYLCGLMAGALTESNVIGYMAAFPIPEVKRHLNAFAMGAREVNPDAEIMVRWIYAWYDPAAGKEATEALIAEGADVFMFTEDSPTVPTVAAEYGYPSFSHYAPMHTFAPDYVVSGKLVKWEAFYLDFLAKVYAGMYTSENLADVDWWGLLADDASELGADWDMPVNPVFEEQLSAYMVDDPLLGEISVYDLVFTRLEQMADPQMVFDPFAGPIYDRQGILRVPEGARMDYDSILTLEWAAEGVVGPWPGEPTE